MVTLENPVPPVAGEPGAFSNTSKLFKSRLCLEQWNICDNWHWMGGREGSETS